VLFCALPIYRRSYIGRLQNWEVQKRYRIGRRSGTEIRRYEIQRCGDTEMGGGAEPLFPSFLPVFSSYLLDAERIFCPSIWAL
jgi:hypothetical protein